MTKKLICCLFIGMVASLVANTSASQSQIAVSPTSQATDKQTWQQTALGEIKKQITGRENEPAEQVFKNIEVLKGKSASRLPGMMSALTGLLGVDCTHCHVRDQWDKEDKPTKQITRQHFQMQAQMNKEFFNGQNAITCWTCHRGQPKPEKISSSSK